jgi:hypothetical protein
MSQAVADVVTAADKDIASYLAQAESAVARAAE